MDLPGSPVAFPSKHSSPATAPLGHRPLRCPFCHLTPGGHRKDAGFPPAPGDAPRRSGWCWSGEARGPGSRQGRRVGEGRAAVPAPAARGGGWPARCAPAPAASRRRGASRGRGRPGEPGTWRRRRPCGSALPGWRPSGDAWDDRRPFCLVASWNTGVSVYFQTMEIHVPPSHAGGLPVPYRA